MSNSLQDTASWVTINEATEIAKVSADTLRRAIASGKLRSMARDTGPGTMYFLDRNDVAKFGRSSHARAARRRSKARLEMLSRRRKEVLAPMVAPPVTVEVQASTQTAEVVDVKPAINGHAPVFTEQPAADRVLEKLDAIHATLRELVAVWQK